MKESDGLMKMIVKELIHYGGGIKVHAVYIIMKDK